jgi:predicted nucleic acid-binding protein
LIVIDASAMTEFLLETARGRRVEERLYRDGDRFCAPHIMDLEVLRALRGLTLSSEIDPARAEEAIADLLAVPVLRYPHYDLVGRAWDLRHNLSVYDASYVALAETLDAVVVTCDGPLSRAPGHSARVDLIQ